MKRFAAVMLLSLVICGCTEKPKIERCWSPDAKKVVEGLARNAVIDYLVAILKASGGNVDDAQVAKINTQLNLETKNYHATGANEIGALTCGTQVDMKLHGNNGKIYTGSLGSLPFNVLPSENEVLFYQVPDTTSIKAMA